ncbi:MAG: hypothetical protein ACXABY_13260 [Candidatus Thorarchaeota archaeon]
MEGAGDGGGGEGASVAGSWAGVGAGAGVPSDWQEDETTNTKMKKATSRMFKGNGILFIIDCAPS